MILDHESDHFDLLQETAELANVPYITYGRSAESDYEVKSLTSGNHAFHLIKHNGKLDIEADYEIQLAGDFNQENAASAIIAAALTGASIEDAQKDSKQHVCLDGWIS